MLIFLIGIIVLVTFLNWGIYEYRVLKNTDGKDIFESWVQMKLKKRYK